MRRRGLRAAVTVLPSRCPRPAPRGPPPPPARPPPIVASAPGAPPTLDLMAHAVALRWAVAAAVRGARAPARAVGTRLPAACAAAGAAAGGRAASTAAALQPAVPDPLPLIDTARAWMEPMDMVPASIVAALDKHIVGQADAKRAVAIALRNRWRRMRLTADQQDEIIPKNILMVRRRGGCAQAGRADRRLGGGRGAGH